MLKAPWFPGILVCLRQVAEEIGVDDGSMLPLSAELVKIQLGNLADEVC